MKYSATSSTAQPSRVSSSILGAQLAPALAVHVPFLVQATLSASTARHMIHRSSAPPTGRRSGSRRPPARRSHPVPWSPVSAGLGTADDRVARSNGAARARRRARCRGWRGPRSEQPCRQFGLDGVGHAASFAPDLPTETLSRARTVLKTAGTFGNISSIISAKQAGFFKLCFSPAVASIMEV